MKKAVGEVLLLSCSFMSFWRGPPTGRVWEAHPCQLPAGERAENSPSAPTNWIPLSEWSVLVGSTLGCWAGDVPSGILYHWSCGSCVFSLALAGDS